MTLYDDLLATLPDGEVREVTVGAQTAAVVVEVEGRRQCGLVSRLRDKNHPNGDCPVKNGFHSARELAQWVHSPDITETAIGMATINALLPRQEQHWVDINAEEVIALHGAHKHVVLVGHFSFVSRLRERVGKLSVLELRPRGDDLPAEAAPRVVPQADVVALTGTTLLNHTFEGLLNLCRPEAKVLVLGPTTPLSPVMFRHGVNYLCGSLIENEKAVLQAVSQGAGFKKIHRQGARLVSMPAFA